MPTVVTSHRRREDTVGGCAITLPLPDTALSLPDVDAEPDQEPELSRVTVVVGGLRLDVGLPDDMSVAALADDVIRLANAQLSAQREPVDAEFDMTNGKWTLARLGAQPFDAERSLAEFSVCDGEVLVIREDGTPCAPPLFDDLDVDIQEPDSGQQRMLVPDAPMVGSFTVALIASVAASLLLVRQSPALPVVAVMLVTGAVGAIAACIAGYGSTKASASPWLSAVAIPLLFAGALHIVPGASGATALPVAFGVIGFVALVVLLTSGRGRSFHTAVIGLSVLGIGATVAVLLWAPPARTAGAILATASVVVVYLAPRVTILLSKLPIPPVPTAGEPLDDIETQGGTTVEGVNAVGKQVIPTEQGMIERIGTSNQYLTGIIAAATATGVVGSYLAIDVSNGFFWQGTAFAIAVACVLCLRGRSHYDVVQSATLIGGGLLTGLALIAKTAAHLDGWQLNAMLALVVVMGLVVGCGVVAPRLEFSPVMKRQLEILEYLAITVLFPLCLWITRLYAFFRELRL